MTAPAKTDQMDRRALGLLSLGHALDDMNQGALPAMLPFFIVAHDLSYSAAAGLVLAVTISSSVLQPLLGQLSDRHPAPWLAPGGLLLAGGGLALASVMPSYLLTLLAVGISGVGVAAFHPEAARLANYAAGPRRATGMSLFSLGGSIGFAIGPLLATPLVVALGLGGGALLLAPVLLAALLLAWQLPSFPERPLPGSPRARAVAGEDMWGAFLLLTGAVVFRSVAFFGLSTFIPLYWRDVLNQSAAAGGMALTILFTAGAMGTLAGGWLADRYGRRPVVLVAMVSLSAAILAFVSARDPLVATLLLVPLGLALSAPGSVMVVMGQEYLPNRVGTASGVTLGLAVSVGGLVAPLLGAIADQSGVRTVIGLLVFVPLAAVAFAAALPNRRVTA